MVGLPATGVEYPTVGPMNEIAIVSTPAGKVVLRGHRRRNQRRVAFEHDLMAYAGAHGIPVPAAISTPEGELVAECDGRFYSLFQHAAGLTRDQLDDDLVTAMGAALGRRA